ncbi:hypothetical protein HGRIS_001831 [Hohenbuehelia grisea]|uniref:Uncharacterized protein n=1 Tax=Hohenbuehelia grisea TaxID=104357 RepID=A0ABR3JIK7_9AGAR
MHMHAPRPTPKGRDADAAGICQTPSTSLIQASVWEPPKHGCMPGSSVSMMQRKPRPAERRGTGPVAFMRCPGPYVMGGLVSSLHLARQPASRQPIPKRPLNSTEFYSLPVDVRLT